MNLLDGLIGGIRKIFSNGREVAFKNAIDFTDMVIREEDDRICISLSSARPAAGEAIVYDGAAWAPTVIPQPKIEYLRPIITSEDWSETYDGSLRYYTPSDYIDPSDATVYYAMDQNYAKSPRKIEVVYKVPTSHEDLPDRKFGIMIYVYTFTPGQSQETVIASAALENPASTVDQYEAGGKIQTLELEIPQFSQPVENIRIVAACSAEAEGHAKKGTVIYSVCAIY